MLSLEIRGSLTRTDNWLLLEKQERSEDGL